jgi:hypothetical protein
VLGEHACLDPLGEVDLLLGGEQRGASDAVEVDADEICRWALAVQVHVQDGIGVGGLLRDGH